MIRPLARLSVQPNRWRALLGTAFGLLLQLAALLRLPQRVTAEELLHTLQRTALYDFARAAANAEALERPVLHAYARDDPIIQAERATELLELIDRDAQRGGPRLSSRACGNFSSYQVITE